MFHNKPPLAFVTPTNLTAYPPKKQKKKPSNEVLTSAFPFSAIKMELGQGRGGGGVVSMPTIKFRRRKSETDFPALSS